MPLELVGDIPLAGVMAKSLKGLFRGKVSPPQVVEWITKTGKELAKATAGETLITTPGQSVMEQMAAQNAGVRDPLNWQDLGTKTGKDMQVAFAQSLLMGGGSVAGGGAVKGARSLFDSARPTGPVKLMPSRDSQADVNTGPGNAEAYSPEFAPLSDATSARARGAQLSILKEERGRVLAGIAFGDPESASGRALSKQLGRLDSSIAKLEAEQIWAIHDLLLKEEAAIYEAYGPKFGNAEPGKPKPSAGQEKTSPRRNPASGPKFLFGGRQLSEVASKRRGEAGYFDRSILLEFGRSIYRAGMDFVDWSVGMIKRFGDKVTPHLTDIWESLSADAHQPWEPENPAGWVYPGSLGIWPMPGLTPEQRDVEARFAQWVEEDLDRAVREYAKIDGTEGGRVIDVDEARKLSRDYNANKQSRTRHTLSVNKVAGAFVAKRLLQSALRNLQPGDVMGLTAGGPGSGKGEIKKVYPQKWYDAKFIYDGVLRRYSVAKDLIENARAAGAKTVIWYVHAPVEQAVVQAMRRGEIHGRVVPLDVLAQSHFDAQRTIVRLLERYGEDSAVKIHVIDNSKETPEIVGNPLDFLRSEGVKYEDEETTETRARRTFKANIRELSDPESRSIFQGGPIRPDGIGRVE